MKDFLKSMLIEVFEDKYWASYIIGGMIWILTLQIAAMIICGVGMWVGNSL